MKSQLSFKQKLYFKYFHSFRWRRWAYFFKIGRVETEENIPKVDLLPENIKNLKTLINRNELIKNMPPNKVVAEIGVFKGDFSELILKLSTPKKLHLIDSWAEDKAIIWALKPL